jgi:cell wall-associated NlpC family hydrolase
MISRQAVIDEARFWLGVKWRHQGRNRAGIDCVGLIVVVMQRLDLSHYDVQGYPRYAEATFMKHFVLAGMTRIGLQQAVPGDVLAFRDEMFPCHAGFYCGEQSKPTCVHAYAVRHQVVEDAAHDLLKERLIAAYRLPGVE